MTPRLEASGVVLRPLTIDDAPALFIAVSDPVAQRYRDQAPHRDVCETARYITDTLARGHGWAITQNDGEALGRIALRVVGDSGEIGIIVRRAMQGRGLGATALRLVEDYAFGALRLRVLAATIDCENQASLRLFERAGFVRDEAAPASVETHAGVRTKLRLLSKEAAR